MLAHKQLQFTLLRSIINVPSFVLQLPLKSVLWGGPSNGMLFGLPNHLLGNVSHYINNTHHMHTFIKFTMHVSMQCAYHVVTILSYNGALILYLYLFAVVASV